MNSRGQSSSNRSSGRRGNTSSNSSSNDRPRQQPQQQQQNFNAPNLSPRDQSDLDTFRIALKELTFNSLPIIEKLTQLARERARNIAGPISRSILDNLVFNNPKLRSCYLFLIDSICKNVGEPYPASFVKHGLVSAYLRVYGEICASGDEGQKRDFLRVLPTWNGILPSAVLNEIEIKVGLTPSQSPTVKSQPQPSISIPPSTTSSLSPATVKLLQDLKGVFENPPGPHISGIVSEIFNRLARGGELRRESLADLDSKAKLADKSSLIFTIKDIISNGQKSSSSSSSRSSAQVQPVKVTPDTPAIPLNFELPPNFQIDLSLLSSIVNLNNSNSSLLLPTPTKSLPSQSSDKHFVDIPLNSAELLVSRPNLFKAFYDDLSLHCKTCGVRFRDTDKGQLRMTAHLDSHFRRNMRLKEKSKRVMARDWFGSEIDWINGKSDADSQSERTVNIFEDLSGSASPNSSSSSTAIEDCFVAANEEEQSSPVKCSVCQELIPLQWNDENELWIFKSCIRSELNQEIVHKNCYQNEPTNPKRQRNNPAVIVLMSRRSSPLSFPESNDWKIILKNESAQQLVLYNEMDRSLQVQDGASGSIMGYNDESSSSEYNVDSRRVCGECGRPWPNKNDINNGCSSSFMDKNYFRLLDISSRQQSPTLLQYPVKKTSNRKKSNSSSPATSPTTEDQIFEHPKHLSDSSINQGYYGRFFREDSKLGRGAGGSVFKCQHVLDGIELGVYAVKKVPVGDDHLWLNRMLREVHILENLRHENIIDYKHAWLEYHQLTPFGPPIPCLFILMQLAEGGNLEEFIVSNKKVNLDPSLLCEWFEQICQGLAHLHRCGILHRDLKPSNILLKAGQDGKVRLLITDFGECTSTSDQQSTTSNRTGATGTIEFVAPELLKFDRKTGHYIYQQSKSTDIWSLGLIFYFMLTGKLPYADIDDIDNLKSAMTCLKQVILPKEANKLPKGFKKALGAMLQVDPELRPTIEQILLLIKEIDTSGVTNIKRINQKQLSLPSSTAKLSISSSSIPPSPVNASYLDENTRISLALFLVKDRPL